MPLVLKGFLLFAVVMLLWESTPGMHGEYSGCEDPKKANVPPTDRALNA
jgi:hypothetical protein